MDLHNESEPGTTYIINSHSSTDGKWTSGYIARMEYGEMIKEAPFELTLLHDSEYAAKQYATRQVKMRIQRFKDGIPLKCVIFTKDDRDGAAEVGERLNVLRNVNDTTPAKILPKVKFIRRVGERTAQVTLEHGKEGPWGNSFTVNFNDLDDIATVE